LKYYLPGNIQLAKEQIAIRLHPDTLTELGEVSKEIRLSRAAVIQLALADFFRNRKLKNTD